MATAKGIIEIVQNSQSISGNYSNVTANFYAELTSGYVYSGYATYPKLTLDGTTETKTLTGYDLNSSNKRVFLGSITKNVYHNDNGARTVSASFSWDPENSYLSTVTGSASKPLTTIPRYLSITAFEIYNVTETSAVVKWATSDPRSGTYYSLDNGANWIGSATYGESLASDGKSGTFNIQGLSPNTAYNLKIKIKRTDSGLWTETANKKFTTYNYPYCTSSPDFVIGNELGLNIYNPLGRTCTIFLQLADGKRYGGDKITGSSIKGYVSESWKNWLYNSIPNSQSGKYRVIVEYGSITNTRDAGNTYRIRGNEVPTINAFDYIDFDDSVVAITGNNLHIVQNKSNLAVRFHDATANYGAGGISKYTMVCNGIKAEGTKAGQYYLGKVDSERDVTLTLTATDSRGLSASKSINVTVLPYQDPKAVVTLNRLNNYEDETYLTVDGSVSSVNDKNTMKIEYQYKASGGTYGSITTISDNTKQTLSLDKNTAYIFRIIVTDAFGSKYDREHILDKGVFPLFIDTVKNSVGINGFPKENKSLEINGVFNVFNVYKCCKNILLGSNDGLTITVNGFANSDKIPIIVAGADNSSMTPVLTVIHLRSGSGFGHISLGLDSTITRDGKRLHINASQWSYFTVFAPLGADIELSNSAL